MKQTDLRRKRWECTIILTLFFALCYAAVCDTAQQQLADDVIRLRVVAHSDSAEDQRLKLQVRDRILTLMQPLQQQADSPQQMKQLLREQMQAFANAAQQEVYENGHTERITACLAYEWYPTREYETFALPAGKYNGLQIRIGQAQGHNWWCVLYPSLCLDLASEQQLTSEEHALIHQEGPAYTFRFRTAELLGNLRNMLS